jgi:hypothetical protein
MNIRILTNFVVVLAMLCFALIVALWLYNFDIVVGQLGDKPDWRVVVCPRRYFLALYAVQFSLVVAGVWAYRKRK